MSIVPYMHFCDDLNIAVPKTVTLDDGRVLLIRSWTPTVSINDSVTVEVVGVLAREVKP